MILTYIFHSGFSIEFDKYSIIIDYFRDSNEDGKSGFVHNYLLKKSLPLYVLSTHSHHDHFNSEVLQWKKEKKDITYIFSSDILENNLAKESDAIYIQKLGIYQDANLRMKAFGSTDLGISFYIEADSKKIFHAGDLNNWHWDEESTPKEIKVAEDYFQRELNLITNEIKHLNIAIFPLDPRLGKHFMKGAQQFTEAIQTDILAPMHFSSDPKKIKEFKSFAEKHHLRYLCWEHPGESVII